VWQKIHTQLRQQVRKSVEKTDNPTAGIIDSQSVKTAEKRGKCTVTMAANELKDVSDLSSLIP
jgi:putative transposase